MAYELLGKNPKSALGLCVRLNIWKWYEFVRMLKAFAIISDSEIPLWMVNDQIKLSEKEAILLSKNIRLNLNNFDKFISELYEENLAYSHMPWHREVCCPVLNSSDIEYVLLFLDKCGGFEVR
jgi:hypothetical protein